MFPEGTVNSHLAPYISQELEPPNEDRGSRRRSDKWGLKCGSRNPGPTTAHLIEMLPRLFALRQQLLTRSTLDAMSSLSSAKLSHGFSAKHVSKLLASVLDNDTAWESKDSNALLSLLQLVEGCVLRWHHFWSWSEKALEYIYVWCHNIMLGLPHKSIQWQG